MSDLWVARLHISPATSTKISSKHGLDAQEVKAHIECNERLFYTWDDDPERGLRAIVQFSIRSRSCLAVLYPSDDLPEDEYWLGSVYPRRR